MRNTKSLELYELIELREQLKEDIKKSENLAEKMYYDDWYTRVNKRIQEYPWDD